MAIGRHFAVLPVKTTLGLIGVPNAVASILNQYRRRRRGTGQLLPLAWGAYQVWSDATCPSYAPGWGLRLGPTVVWFR